MLAMHLNKKTDFEPTCETRLPRSPGLPCGAAGPCKHSQFLTLCHMPSMSVQKTDELPLPAFICMESQSLTHL